MYEHVEDGNVPEALVLVATEIGSLGEKLGGLHNEFGQCSDPVGRRLVRIVARTPAVEIDRRIPGPSGSGSLRPLARTRLFRLAFRALPSAVVRCRISGNICHSNARSNCSGGIDSRPDARVQAFQLRRHRPQRFIGQRADRAERMARRLPVAPAMLMAFENAVQHANLPRGARTATAQAVVSRRRRRPHNPQALSSSMISYTT